MIETRIDEKRGCGWRQPGGVYLVAPGPAAPCGLLPYPLDCCGGCGAGIKPARGWTWVQPKLLMQGAACVFSATGCGPCPLRELRESGARAGLLWVGWQHYPTPGHFLAEAIRLGISRRIGVIPRGFEVGKTWVLLAHRRTYLLRDCKPNPQGEHKVGPGIFAAFRPTALEYVVKGDETEADLTRLICRGLTPMRIERKEVTHRGDDVE